jgi:hypothetical protein
LAAGLFVVARALRSGPPPARIAARHVPTWAYDDGTPAGACNGGTGAAPSLVDRWVTYAESNCGPESLTTKAVHDCIHGGVRYCTPVAYLEANWNYEVNADPRLGVCDPVVPSSEPETWWLHTPGSSNPEPATRLQTAAGGGGYLLNQRTPAVRAWFARYVRNCLADYPALMLDDTGAGVASLLFSSAGAYASSREIDSSAALVAGHQEMAAALSQPGGRRRGPLQIDNGLSANDSLAPPFRLLNHPGSVRGLIAEGAPVDDGLITPDAADPPSSDPNFYATLLDELARVDNMGDADFVVLLSYDRTGSPTARLIQQATVMLGADGGHVVDWADLETGDSGAADLAVWPEEGIVPTDPIKSMSAPSGRGCLAGVGVVCPAGGHHDLQAPGAPGVYVREFDACYDRGALFGPCAAIVNDTATGRTVAEAWLTQDYDWQIGLRGGDVQSGGTVEPHGAPFRAGATVIAPWSAMLLAGPRAAA